jgi:hypothetical protein
MTFRKLILLPITLGMIAALVACSSGPGPVTISLSSVSSPLTVNSATPVTATLTNTTNTVTWSVTCATTACGTFSAPTTASGAAVTYTAPAFVTTNVVITATVTGTSIAASTSAITIGGATLADGNYVYSLSGWDFTDESPYTVAGAFTVASGAITAGEQDFNDIDFPDLFDQINPTGSAVTVTADGNVQITLVTCLGAVCTSTDPDVGVGGTETINGTVLPLSTTGKTFIAEFDASAESNGELDAQTSAAASPLSGGYAFVLNGIDIAFGSIAIGGIINVDSSGGISGTGSIFDLNDEQSGLAGQGETFGASTVTVTPDAFGRVTFTLNPTVLPELTLNGYIVDANHIRLTEGNNDGFECTTGGVALTQGANTGTFTNAAVAGNTYVVGLGGSDGNGFLQAVGQLTLTASPAPVSGFVDFNDLTGSDTFNPDAVTAPAYAVDSAGAGDFTIEGVTDASATISYNVQLYLDGNGNALAITLDLTDVLGGTGAQQAGAGSFTAASFAGPYGFGTGGVDFNYDGPFATVGPVTADGVGTISGFADVNWLNFFAVADETFTGAPVTGTFVTTGAAAANGIFGGTITGLDLTTCTLFTAGAPGCTADVFDYYLLDATGDNIAIETDINQLTLGVFQQQ